LTEADDSPAQLDDLDDGSVRSLWSKTQFEWGVGRCKVGRSRKSPRLVISGEGAWKVSRGDKDEGHGSRHKTVWHSGCMKR
jgi:hypothetical protein